MIDHPMSGLSNAELDSLSAGIPAQGMPAQAADLGQCDPTPDAGKLMAEIEVLNVRVELLMKSHLMLCDILGVSNKALLAGKGKFFNGLVKP